MIKTLILLNLQGSFFIALLLCLKKVIRKALPAGFERLLWILAALLLLLPLWKVVPFEDEVPIIFPMDTIVESEYNFQEDTDTSAVIEVQPSEGVNFPKTVDITGIIIGIYIFGAGLFLIVTVGSYVVFLIKKKNNSRKLEINDCFLECKRLVGIKRKVLLRCSDDMQSPFLTGIIFPIIYMPKRELDEYSEKMIYIHELMHFKHRDLLLKWFLCIINALNWFNPFVYAAVKSFNEACEIYCDESVTKEMTEDEKKQYMNMIMDLIG